MTISRADTVVGEHFTATSSRLRLHAEIELDRFPSVAALTLKPKRCSRLVATRQHAIFAPCSACDTIDDSVSVPVRLFQQLRITCEMAVGHQIARTLPAADVSRGNCPGRTGQVPFAGQKLKIYRCSEKCVSIHPVLDFSEFLKGHSTGEKEICRPHIESCGHVSPPSLVVVARSDGVSVNAKI